MTQRDYKDRMNELLASSYGPAGSEDRSLTDIRGHAAVHAIRQHADRAHKRADNALLRAATLGNRWADKLGLAEDELDDFVDRYEALGHEEQNALDKEMGFNVGDALVHAVDYRDNGDRRRQEREKTSEAARRAAERANDFEANAQAAEEVERRIFASRYWGMDKLQRRQEAARLGLDPDWTPPEETNAFGKPYNPDGF